ncbi:UNVERIFIED_CONTAM: hypothetical protein H355_001981 [Colinus virginianus]|nr:hypothetical protein H355_001981 [Colinus virginianus]
MIASLSTFPLPGFNGKSIDKTYSTFPSKLVKSSHFPNQYVTEHFVTKGSENKPVFMSFSTAHSAFDYDTENMNSEDIYSSLRGVTEAIQNFSFRSQEDMNEPVKRDSKKDDVDSVSKLGASWYWQIKPIPDFLGKIQYLFNCQHSVCVHSFLLEPPMDHSDLVAELLKELSNHNERVEERKAALYELMKLTQEESFGVWDEHFKTILLLLLETLGDKEVVRSAEEAASMLATSISPDQCIKVLCPIIQTADYPINLAAIKMQTKVIERVSKETLTQLLPEIVPGLIQGYDNSESSVRKACVFCLVAIHAVIGDELKPHLSQLTGSKMKLLNLYIKRAQTGSGPGDTAADMTGQS